MKLIVGLGNPGKQYENTRHNVGFEVIDVMCQRHGITLKLDKNFDGYIGSYQNNNEKILVLKPTTFMNLSGQSVIKVASYFKVPIDDIIVIVDDINLDLGVLRLREKGSAGGHNGLKSIISHLGTNEFKRLRVGIKFEKGDLINHVLGKFTKKELAVVGGSFLLSADAVDLFIQGDLFSNIMTKYNTPAIL